MTGSAELSRQLWVDFRSLSNLLGSGDSKQTCKSKDKRHCGEAVMGLFLLCVIYHGDQLSYILSWLTMNPPDSSHRLHNADLPQVEMRRRSPEWPVAACLLYHQSGNIFNAAALALSRNRELRFLDTSLARGVMRRRQTRSGPIMHSGMH